MARPPLELETWGRIRRTVVDGKQTAVARYRDVDGVTRAMQRQGRTPAEAERNLIKALKQRLTPVQSELGRDTTIAQLCAQWLTEIDASDLADGTKNQYRSNASIIARELKGVRISEATVPRMDRYIAGVRDKRGPGAARSARLVLKLMLAIPVRHGVIDANPIREVPAPARARSTVTALRARDIATIRELLHTWDAGTTKYNRPRNGSLRDIADMYIATGARTSEVLAIEWPDVTLDTTPQTVEVTKTVAKNTAGKLVLQPVPKSESSNRLLLLPPAVAGMLVRRRVESYTSLVFPSGVGTPIWPDNLRRQWKLALEGTDYAALTPKAFRKAVATHLREQLGIEAASAQLGHSDTIVTQRHYAEKVHRGPDAAAVLDSLFTQNGE
ncbi:tyrosine-type recombinase/integrase [Microbacterium sp. MMO-56]|uniref:tyrosine-type recombinase/integrase n=1 Tax=Microbacterium sp. MMO-56 TaxID=3081281 RepID=UPI00301AED4F